jgi:hypothetical protein
MNEVKFLELLCKVRAIEATLLAGPYKKDYLMYLNYFDAKIVEELQAGIGDTTNADHEV